MADEKNETGVMGGILLIVFLVTLSILATTYFGQTLWDQGCEERCYPHQMESMTPATGCVCAEAQ